IAAQDRLHRGFGIKAKPRRPRASGAVRSSTPRIWNQGKAEPGSARSARTIVYTADLESRQSRAGQRTGWEMERLHRGFGIKAKPVGPDAGDVVGSSTPRIWNQGKARGHTGRTAREIVYTADLESRQSGAGDGIVFDEDRLHRGFGIKAKPCWAAP